MITETNVRGVQNGKKLVSLALKSTDSKPTEGVMNGSTCIEVNTGKTYVYDEEGSEWTEISSSGGGGGGGGSSDFSTAEVTVTNGSGLPFAGYGCQFSDENNTAFTEIYLEGNGALDLILYKGASDIDLLNSISKSAVALSGDVEGVEDMFESNKYKGFTVTGDCTITIS